MARDFFYIKNNYLTDSPQNITFHEAHLMNDASFNSWVMDLKKRVRFNWKKYKTPPSCGANDETSITDALQHISTRSVDDCVITDSLTGKDDCLINRTKTASVVNNFMPTMWKTVDVSVGVSAYELFHTDKQENRVRLLFRRHFQKDGFYLYTKFAKGDGKCVVEAETTKEWIKNFKNNRPDTYSNYDFFIDGKLSRKDNSKLTITKKELIDLHKQGYIKKRHLNKIEAGMNGSRIKFSDCSLDQLFYIRYYDKNLKLFPRGSRVFRGAMNIDATNFSPFVAKWLWLTYTEPFKNDDEINLLDTSYGWSGRLCGALAASSQRPNLKYIGTDPNPDLWIEELSMTRAEYFADHYERCVSQSNYLDYDFFDCGSEDLHKQKRFRKYKNRISVAFTSPQYWKSELYSYDERQSAIKFPKYSDWVEGYLEPTIRLTAEYLRKGGYLCWNIADVADPYSNRMLPLERDSIKAMKSAGLEIIKKHKYVLGNPPGAGKIGKTHNRPTYKNFTEVNGTFRKIEPIYVCIKR